jgi:hypothetical protein
MSIVSGADDSRRRWNEVPVGDTIINVERPPAHLAKIDLDSINYTPAGEKWPHKDQCACCRMYFHKESMITRVPNHRVLDMRKKMGVPMEGQRYSTASYLYANSKVCVLCTQLFDYPVEERETPKSTLRVLNASGSSYGVPNDDNSVGSSNASVTSVRGTERRFQRNSMLTPQKELIKKRMNKADAEKVGKYKLEIKTALQRANVAMLDAGCRTYQSSIVDNMDSTNAVTVPYHAWSKTRREVDPWWEIDFGGRPRNIHSISFLSNMASKENISIMVLLLKRPVGFENPFLDKVQGEAVQYREFQLIPIEEGAESSKYYWELGSCTCEAVRVQLRGIKPLAVKEFKAFLGDDFVRFDEEQAKKVIHQSFATFSPSRQEKALHSMLVESKKAIPVVGLQHDTGPKVFRGPNRDALFAETAILDQKVMERYRRQQAWNAKTLRIVNSAFGEAEIKALFYQVFACALLDEKKLNYDAAYLTTANMKQIGFALLGGGVKEAEVEREKEERKEREREKKRKEEEEMAALRAMASDAGLDSSSLSPTAASTASAGMTASSPDGIPKMASKSYDVDDDNISYHSLNSHGSVRKKEVVDRAGALILNAAISMPEPRCSLSSLHAKLRHIILTIQSSGIHLKIPELISLSQNTRLAKICDDPNLSNESLHDLLAMFDRIERHWDIQDEKAEKANRQKQEVRRSANMLRTGKMELTKEDEEKERLAPRKAVQKTTRGVSWSQAAVAVALWINNASAQIPASVFGVTLDEEHGSLFHLSSNSGTPRSGGKYDLEVGTGGADLDGFGSSSAGLRGRNSGAKPGGPSGGRGDEPPPGFLDTRFSEYKLSNFKRRFLSEPEFPSSLNPNFSSDDLFREAKEKEKARLSAEWAAKIEEKRGKDESKKDEVKIIWPDDEPEKGPEEASAAPASASPMPGSPLGGGPMAAIAAAAAFKQDSPEKESGEFLGLPYVCALCTKRFPYNSTNCKVMYKHIITIRREWDPKLVPQEMETLEQGTSMFNLSNICSFCAQFFDPDVAGGISFPMKATYAKKQVQYTSDPRAESLVSKFFDSRYGLDENLDPSEFLHRPATSKFRESARFAIEVSQRIQDEKEAEEARVAAAKKLNEKGNSAFTEEDS